MIFSHDPETGGSIGPLHEIVEVFPGLEPSCQLEAGPPLGGEGFDRDALYDR